MGDSDLIPGNIKQGVNLFGVNGTLSEGKNFVTSPKFTFEHRTTSDGTSSTFWTAYSNYRAFVFHPGIPYSGNTGIGIYTSVPSYSNYLSFLYVNNATFGTIASGGNGSYGWVTNLSGLRTSSGWCLIASYVQGTNKTILVSEIQDSTLSFRIKHQHNGTQTMVTMVSGYVSYLY